MEASHQLTTHSATDSTIVGCQATSSFSDDMALTQLDEFSQEERFITLGMDGFGRLLVVVYTWRGTETIRIISARNGTTHERALYKGDSA